jgi:tetratricopeptide (TPR) repeat protein
LRSFSFLLHFLPAKANLSFTLVSRMKTTNWLIGFNALKNQFIRYCLSGPQKIAGYYQSLEAWDQIIYFFGSYVSENPSDPYNALYLFYVAEAYLEKSQRDMANLYYRRILGDYRDLYTPESIHFLCLKRLVEYETDPYLRLSFFKALISRFQDKIDLGYTYYKLSKTYEELRDWDASMQSLRTFLKYPQTVIPGEPEAWSLSNIKKGFHDSDKNWVEQDLNRLIRRIKSAIEDKDWVRLEDYRNQVNFFGQTWESRGEDEEFLQNEQLNEPAEKAGL